ncbi:hypothetical protein C8A00DRAFT_35010 [Chaetomidium leptoderma]|uniref:Uncharacterized protein n=1 Tax=Chaetomidium leptoderma TaxID=669021 RepID=A0AAN6ZUE9_9PEZI|nr:hypothetical protein C8A00DRAFT_35010 [Chaetomidium leptoderma]
MAPNSRAPSLPSIPDIALDLDEKMYLLPELDETLSSTGESSSTALDDDYDFRPTRSHSTHTQHSFHHRRIVLPVRFPSISSNNTHATYTTLPPTPHRQDLVSQTQPLQLPPTQKTIHESWTITYHHPLPRTKIHIRAFGLTLWRQFERGGEEGSILSVVPNTHFAQDELAATVGLHETSVAVARTQTRRSSSSSSRRLSKVPQAGGGGGSRSGGVGGGGWGVYAADLEGRIRALEWKVQDEIYELLSDRVQSSSNAFRRREWRVVVLTEIPGGELTDSPTAFGLASKKRKWFGAGDRVAAPRAGWAPDMPITEYRLILRGTETRTNDQGWGSYNRYSRPWAAADEKEIGEKKRWSTFTGKSDKYVDF